MWNIWLCTYHGKHIIAHENSLILQDPSHWRRLSWMKLLFPIGKKGIFRHFRKSNLILSVKITDLNCATQISLVCPIYHNLNCWCALLLQGSKVRGPLDRSGSVDSDTSMSSTLSSTNKVSKAWDNHTYLDTSKNIPWNN